MNLKLKAMLNDYPFIDYVDMNGIEFNVIQMDDSRFNVIIDIFELDTTKDDFPTEYGMGIRTTLFGDSLVELSKSIGVILNLGMFEHLTFISESVCLDNNGDVAFEFNWDDYLDSDNTSLN